MDESEERVLSEFAELQEKVLLQADMSSRVQQQERLLAHQKQRNVLTAKELSGMPDTTTMYKSIGRAYFASPKAAVVGELEARAASLESDARKLREQREAIDAKMRETDSQMRELVGQSPTLARRLGAIKIK